MLYVLRLLYWSINLSPFNEAESSASFSAFHGSVRGWMHYIGRCEGASWKRWKLNIFCYKISSIPLSTPRSQRLQWLMQGFTYAANGGGRRIPTDRALAQYQHSTQPWSGAGVDSEEKPPIIASRRGSTQLFLGKDSWVEGHPFLQLWYSPLGKVERGWDFI